MFFNDAVQHLVRLCRALRNKGLHVIQLGVGGTGRSASARLAAFIAGSMYHQLNIRRNYTLADLRDDLKAILLKCGSQKKTCTLFINELHILQVTTKQYKSDTSFKYQACSILTDRSWYRQCGIFFNNNSSSG